MKRLFVLALMVIATVSVAYAQADADGGTGKGRALMQEMVQALGGQKWLGMKNEYNEGRIAGYFHGRPDDTFELFFDWREPLGPEREELTKKRNVVELYHGDTCTEVDYKGAHPQVKKICESYQRRRKHSIEYAVRKWMKEPGTVVMFDGQKLAEDHLVDQVTVMNEADDSITILLDDDSHLPLELRYEWRDPVYHDMDKDVVEFSNYHKVDGIETPYTTTYIHNGQMREQRYLFYARYNVTLPPDGFSVEKTVRRIAGKR
ncbi:MAG: hypothetical protein ACP5M4_09540 [Acidobacteriaceae bacterium]